MSFLPSWISSLKALRPMLDTILSRFWKTWYVMVSTFSSVTNYKLIILLGDHLDLLFDSKMLFAIPRQLCSDRVSVRLKYLRLLRIAVQYGELFLYIPCPRLILFRQTPWEALFIHRHFRSREGASTRGRHCQGWSSGSGYIYEQRQWVFLFLYRAIHLACRWSSTNVGSRDNTRAFELGRGKRGSSSGGYS
jgi:hypothetical protein